MISCVSAKKKKRDLYFHTSIVKQCCNSALFDDVRSTMIITESPQKTRQLPVIDCLLSSNQNAARTLIIKDNKNEKVTPIASRKLIYKEDISEESEIKVSNVYIRNNENKAFRLTFKATQVVAVPLYTRDRTFPGRHTEKQTQSYSKSYYFEQYSPHLTQLFSRKKDFAINYRKDGCDSVMSMKQKIGHAKRREPSPVKPPPEISADRTNLRKSVVYLCYKGITYKLHPKTMSLEFTRPLNQDAAQDTNSQKKNRGCIICKCYGDVLKFTFHLTEVSYQHIPELITRAAQAKDDAIYIRCFSECRNKYVFVPLPQNLYRYKDPMIDIIKRNQYMKYHRIEPKWMRDTRKKRLLETNACRHVDYVQKAFDATTGSSITYEGQDSINRVRDGLIPCEISSNDRRKYEEWITQMQFANHSLPTVSDDDFDKFETTANYEVPDCDLVIYNK